MEKDIQESSPGAGLPCTVVLLSHPAPCRVVSTEVMAGATTAVCSTGMMEDCNACKPVEIRHAFYQNNADNTAALKTLGH